MAVVIGFSLVVGPEPSVLRAVVMAVLVLVATLLDRDASVTNSLALAALAILAVRPGDLFDPGFQLSFVATLGIVVAPLPRGAILGALAVSAAAQLAVLPVTLTHFNQLSTIVVEIPDGRALLVDCGSGGPMRLDAGERVVAPFLWNRGVLRLAAMAVTHDDSDHAGGAASVRRLFAIDEEWTAASLPLVPRRFGRVEITPLPPTAATGGRRNESALVLRIEMGLASFLLASDIGAFRERELVAAGTRLDSTVLKVAHHGSRSSTGAAFLRAVGPRFVAISVGARNPYGHPDAGVVARLAEVGAETYRTDRDGALIFEADGETLTVTRWATRRVDRFCLDPEAIC